MSVVSDALASMVAGEWRRIHYWGDGSGLETASSVCAINKGAPMKIFDFSSKCVYDAERKRLYYHGGSHLPICNDDPGIEKFANLAYDFASAQFTKLPYTAFDTAFATAGTGNFHTYQQQTFAAKHRLWISKFSSATQILAVNTDVAGVSSITDAGYPNLWNRLNLGLDSDTGYNRGPLEYFPERDSVFHFSMQSLALYEMRLRDQVQIIRDTTTFDTLGSEGLFLHYSHIHKKLVLGGGRNSPYKVWTIGSTADVTAAPVITQLDNGPGLMSCDGYAVPWIDPVSGNLMVIAAWDIVGGAPTSAKRFYELNLATGHWTRQTSEEATLATIGVDGLNALHADYVFDVVGCGLPDLGGTIFLGQDVWLYKRDNNTYATTGPDKTLQPGHLAKIHFTSRADLKPTWPLSDTLLTAELASRGYSTHYDISHVRGPGEGNTAVTVMPVGAATSFAIPDVDSDGLKYSIPSQAQANPGSFFGTFDNVLHAGDTQSWYVSPVSPHGRVVYLQFREKLDAAFLAHHSRNGEFQEFGYLTTPSAGSTTLNSSSTNDWTAPANSTGDLVPATLVGRQIYINDSIREGYGTNWIGGFYTIAEVFSAHSLRLSTSPTPSAAGIGGYGQMGGRPWTGRWAGTLSTSSGGSRVLHNAGGAYVESFTTAMVGKIFTIFSNSGGFPLGPNFVAGYYLVESYQSATQITLATSPTPSGTGSAGYGSIGSPANGFKSIVIQGCPPYGDTLTTVIQNDQQLDLPHMYGDIGNVSASYNIVAPYLPDVFQEFTVRMEVKGAWYGTLSTSGAGSTTLAIIDAPWVDKFTSSMVGDVIHINAGGGFTAGNYTVTGYTDTTHVVLSSSPTSSGAGSAGTGYTNLGNLSRVTLWVDGVLAIDWTNRHLLWGPAAPDPTLQIGPGQYEQTFYQTQKDPSEAHPDGYAWVQDIITSTEPIPMALGAGSTTEPPPVPRPELIYPFLIKVS